MIGVLSPYLFSRYNRDLIGLVNGASVGCAVGGQFINVPAYADDLVVLIAPYILAWFTKVTCSSSAACLCSIDSYCDTSTTVCMMFLSIDLDRALTRDFFRYLLLDIQTCNTLRCLNTLGITCRHT